MGGTNYGISHYYSTSLSLYNSSPSRDTAVAFDDNYEEGEDLLERQSQLENKKNHKRLEQLRKKLKYEDLKLSDMNHSKTNIKTKKSATNASMEKDIETNNKEISELIS